MKSRLKESIKGLIREELGKSKKKLLKEYLVRAGQSLDEVGALNLFTDFAEGQLLSDYEDEFAESKKWMAIESKYSKIADSLWKIIEKNKKIKLDEDDVDLIENSWYDGSDAYDDMDEAVSYLPKVYNKQIKVIQQVLRNHGIKI